MRVFAIVGMDSSNRAVFVCCCCLYKHSLLCLVVYYERQDSDAHRTHVKEHTKNADIMYVFLYVWAPMRYRNDGIRRHMNEKNKWNDDSWIEFCTIKINVYNKTNNNHKVMDVYGASMLGKVAEVNAWNQRAQDLCNFKCNREQWNERKAQQQYHFT